MARKIILYLSSWNKERSKGEEKYRCPDGKTVTGIRTSEAPIKFLLNNYPDVSQIICVLTPQAEKTAWEPVREYIGADYPQVEFVPVRMRPGDDFGQKTLQKVLDCVRTGDEILLETTGGLRNTVMDLLLLSRVLGFIGIRVLEAVYSDLGEHRIKDISEVFHRFDLVSGMQELTNFGSVETLSRYYGQDDELIRAMKELTDTIQLCRTRNVDQAMEHFNQAMDKAEQTCSDPLMKALLPAFREKFKGKLTLPGLILWCVESNMIQQALTIYNERVPAYILNKGNGIAYLSDDFVMDKELNPYEDQDCQKFYCAVRQMARNAHPKYAEGGWDTKYVAALEKFDQVLPDSWFRLTASCSAERLREIVMDMLHVTNMRNMVNHASEDAKGWTEMQRYLERQGRRSPENITVEEIRESLRSCAVHLAPKLGRAKKKG